jgi:3-isopropylmalate/(R)-2-methylmalate dehydratase small subunit
MFEIDLFRKRCLLEGLDDIGLTLTYEETMAAFETRYHETYNWTMPRQD